MRHFLFLAGIITLFLTEYAFLPGILDHQSYIHLGFIILLSAMYGDWFPWMTGLSLYLLLTALFLQASPLLLASLYIILGASSWLLAHTVLGARSLSSYILYAFSTSLGVTLIHSSIYTDRLFTPGIFAYGFLFVLLLRFIIPRRSYTFDL